MSPEEDQFVGMDYVLRKFGFSRRTLYRHIKAKLFPAPEKVGRLSRYRKSVIDALFANWGQPGFSAAF